MARLTIVEFREELRSRGFDGFPSVDLDRYINFSYYDLARMARWTWEKTEDSFTLDAGSFFVDLGTILRFRNLDTVVREEVEEGKRYKLRPVSDAEWKRSWLPNDEAGRMAVGTPSKYYITRNRLYILPPPDTTANFTAHYWQFFEELSPTVTTPVTPEDLDEIILLGAEVRCHRRARQLVFAGEAHGEWRRMIDQLLSDETLMMDEELERAVPDVR
jgi:hypothetical protein